MMSVVEVIFYRGCLNLITNSGRSSVDIGAIANLELVDTFCCLGNMLSMDGDADAAVEARIELDGINSGS